MKTDEFIKILEKYSAGQATEEEKTLVEAYFDEKKAESPILNVGIEGYKNRLYRKIESSIAQDVKAKPKPSYFKQWAIAASVALALGLFLFSRYEPNPQFHLVETTLGKKQEIQLPDGTIVMLNSGSSIRYPQQFNGDFREVALTGEAFFDVARDTLKPFIVETGEVRTRVLGTSFNINAFAESDSISVSVATGKVMVANHRLMKEILLPNEQLHYHKVTEAYRKATDKSVIDKAWTENTIHLNYKTLNEAVEVLERWFDISIEIQNAALGRKRIVGKYHDPHLETILESLSFLLNIEFTEKSPSNYIVVPKK